MKLSSWSLRVAGSAAFLFAVSCAGVAQRAVRLTKPIEGAPEVVLQGSKPGRATAANDVGELAANSAMGGVTLVFNRSTAQQSALEELLAAQQNPSSPQYHQWLTPTQFGERFGMSDADLTTVESWLKGQGFSIVGVTKAKDRVTFSGTAGQVNAAFGTSMHRFNNGERVEYAPVTDLRLPVALAPIVIAVLHTNTYRPHAMVRRTPVSTSPEYTTANNGAHFLTPKDVATMYDVNTTYNAGFTGEGQTVAIAGETFIQVSDVQNFQSATGLGSNLPTLVLEPNTGGSATYEGDEFESDIDVEYATGMAPGANVMLVYTGDSPYFGVFDSFDYAIEEDLAPVVSISYGSCEPLYTSSAANAGNNLFQQAAAQGQTLIASAGDSGSTECYGYTDSNGNPYPTSIEEGLYINYPADSPYVTSIGGTQMQAGTFAAGTSQYWASAGSSPVLSSLLSYVPEVVWNEDSSTYGFAAGGGGASIIFSAPSWQKGVAGISSTNAVRLNPDISFQASTSSPGYLACSSDPSAFQTGQTSSCAVGIYDSTKKYVTTAGGTSFGAPIFAGLMAVLNQVKQPAVTTATGAGQGSVNAALYGLAANSTTYASVFHDITSGNNDCALIASVCAYGLSSYQATTGYDEASGLGSIDFGNMLAAWPAVVTGTLTTTTTTLSAATTTPSSGASDVITISVGTSGGGTPTGSVSVYLANENAPTYNSTLSTLSGGTLAATLPLTNGTATYTWSGTTTGGTEVITAVYSGDGTHAASQGAVELTLANSQVPTGSFSLSVAPITVPLNSYGSSTVTITPSGGYNGLVNFTIPSLPSSECFLGTDYSGVTTGVLRVNLYIGNGTECTTAAAVRVGNRLVLVPKHASSMQPPSIPGTGRKRQETTLAAGVLAAGLMFRRRRMRRLPSLLVLASLLTAAGLGLNGCGGSGAPVVTTGGGGTTQTFTLSLVGADSVTSSITSSASFTLTVP